MDERPAPSRYPDVPDEPIAVEAKRGYLAELGFDVEDMSDQQISDRSWELTQALKAVQRLVPEGTDIQLVRGSKSWGQSGRRSAR